MRRSVFDAAALARFAARGWIPHTQRFAARAASVPEIAVDESLPIAARADDIVALIRKHQVLVLAGETGSGKSTQLPKLCLAAGRGVAGPDRLHPAAPRRRAQRGAPRGERARHRGRRSGRLSGALHRPGRRAQR